MMYLSHILFFITLIVAALAAVIPLDTGVEADTDALIARKVTTTGTHTGDATWFSVGLGACGWNNVDSDLIVAVSHTLYDNYPGYNVKAGNPNNNPICGKKIKASYKGKSVTVEVVDRCEGCATYDLDLSPTAFSKLAPTSEGRLEGVTWTLE